MSNLTKTIKDLTGEDAVDMFGGDAENVVEELNNCEKCGGETGSKLVGDEVYDKCSDCGWINTP